MVAFCLHQNKGIYVGAYAGVYVYVGVVAFLVFVFLLHTEVLVEGSTTGKVLTVARRAAR